MNTTSIHNIMIATANGSSVSESSEYVGQAATVLEARALIESKGHTDIDFVGDYDADTARALGIIDADDEDTAPVFAFTVAE